MLKNRIALIALASVCTGLAAFGCSSENTDPSAEGADVDLQSVEFNLTVGGAELSTVSYEVTTSTGTVLKSGTFEVPLDEPTFSAALLLPVGTDYTLSISGTGTKESRTVPCAGSEEFDVISGTNAPISVVVTCTDSIEEENTAPATGSVQANVSFVLDTVILPGEECGFTHGVVGPIKQLVGSNIDLKSSYVPVSATTSWSSSVAGVGVIADSSEDDTVFLCSTAGTTVLSTSLTTAGGCTDTFAVEVECVLESCGNGTIDAGEACDDGNTVDTDACSNSCALNPVCGNSIVEAGETCQTCPADLIAANGADACAACGDGNLNAGEDCTSCPADVIAVNGPTACNVCGDGNVVAPEECDDNNIVANDGCNATCEVEFCGDGVAQTNEQCDDGNNAAGDGCSATCTTEVVGPVCGNGIDEAGEDCISCPADQPAGSCDPAPATCGDCLKSDPISISYGIDAYQVSLCDADPTCLAFQACVAETGCYEAPLTNQVCYCGFQDGSGGSSPTGTTPVAVTDCIAPAFQANGPCASILRTGLGSDSPSNQQVIERQFDTQYSAGAGFFLIATASDLGICQTECAY